MYVYILYEQKCTIIINNNIKKSIPEDIKNNFWLFCSIYDMHDVSVSTRNAHEKSHVTLFYTCKVIQIFAHQNENQCDIS